VKLPLIPSANLSQICGNVQSGACDVLSILWDNMEFDQGDVPTSIERNSASTCATGSRGKRDPDGPVINLLEADL